MSDWELASGDIAQKDVQTTPSSSDWEIADSSSIPESQNKEKLEQFNAITGANNTPLGNVMDVLQGVGKSGANIAKLMNKNAPEMPKIGQENTNKIAESFGQYLPFAIAGGPSLLGSTAGAGTFGATQYEPNDMHILDKLLHIPSTGRTQNAIEDMLLNALTFGGTNALMKSLPKQPVPQLNFRQNALFGPTESEFTNVPFKPPSFLEEKGSPGLSENIAQDLHKDISGGKSIEESGKELASHINKAYENQLGLHKNEYENILNSPIGVEDVEGNPMIVRKQGMYEGDYYNNNHSLNYTNNNLQLLHNRYMKNPSIDNGHKLQSELGGEIGYLKKQNQKGNLDAAGKNELSNLVKKQNEIKSDIHNKLESIDPKLKKQYEDVTQSYKENVIPFREDNVLKSISEGKTKNPTSSEIVSIFKNPEESTSRVISFLPENAKKNILHVGMGKNRFQNTPQDILSGFNSIRTKGLESYLHPQHEQSYLNLRNNLEMENAAKMQAEKNAQAVNSLKSIFEESENKRKALSKNALKGFQRAEEEAKQVVSNRQKGLEKEAKTKQLMRQRKANALRSIALGAVGGATGETLKPIIKYISP